MVLMGFQCKHEFCWVCFEEWKKHSSATGGYFKYAAIEILWLGVDSVVMLGAIVMRPSRK